MTTKTNPAEAVSDYAPGGAPITGRKVLIGMVLFFGVIIAANMTMLNAALSSWGGLVVKNSYVASQNFTNDVSYAAAQPIQSWRVELSQPAGADALTLRMMDEAGAPLTGKTVALAIGRPTHERADRVLTLSETAPGVYAAAETLEPGAWRAEAQVTAGAGERTQRRSLRLTVPRAQ
ncbi:MAG: FixH family protein [Pseudomonadota bacterium]